MHDLTFPFKNLFTTSWRINCTAISINSEISNLFHFKPEMIKFKLISEPFRESEAGNQTLPFI